MKMTHELEAAVTFTILMHDVQSKSPGYMLEKYSSTQAEKSPRRILDNNNLAKLKAWMKIWHVED